MVDRNSNVKYKTYPQPFLVFMLVHLLKMEYQVGLDREGIP